MKRFLTLAFAFLFFSPVFAAKEKQPDADLLLARVRYSTTLQKDQKYEGTLTKKKTKLPFGIELKQGSIYFSYSDDNKNWKTFELRFKEKGQELYTYENGKKVKFNAKRYSETIGGTDVTLEDLSLRFLYWPHGTIRPQSHANTVKGRDCYIVDIPNPSPGSGAYASIRTWIDKENGALWQIDAFDALGKHLKRFTITSVQQKGDTWFLKQMKIDVKNPETGKVIASNYIFLK